MCLAKLKTKNRLKISNFFSNRFTSILLFTDLSKNLRECNCDTDVIFTKRHLYWGPFPHKNIKMKNKQTLVARSLEVKREKIRNFLEFLVCLKKVKTKNRLKISNFFSNFFTSIFLSTCLSKNLREYNCDMDVIFTRDTFTGVSSALKILK